MVDERDRIGKNTRSDGQIDAVAESTDCCNRLLWKVFFVNIVKFQYLERKKSIGQFLVEYSEL